MEELDKNGGAHWPECLLVHSEYKNMYIVFYIVEGPLTPDPPPPLLLCDCV